MEEEDYYEVWAQHYPNNWNSIDTTDYQQPEYRMHWNLCSGCDHYNQQGYFFCNNCHKPLFR